MLVYTFSGVSIEKHGDQGRHHKNLIKALNTCLKTLEGRTCETTWLKRRKKIMIKLRVLKTNYYKTNKMNKS